MTGLILHLSAGQGPEECRWVVAQLARVFAGEAAAAGLACEPVEAFSGNPASLLLHVRGEGAQGFAEARLGTIRWIGASPFRPLHKRRNWFIGVAAVPDAGEMPEFREADIDYQTMRASGPGGQHVNTTDSAVRATHRPSGLTTVSRDQRSQFANKKIARLKLAMLLEERRLDGIGAGRQDEWERNRSLERGGAVRTYEGAKFRLRG
ncbi:MAG: peptide chain release factor H [Pseudomonadota bacterium]